MEFVNAYMNCRCMFWASFASTPFASLARLLIPLITALPILSTVTDVTSGSVRCLSGLSVVEIYLGSVSLSFCAGWTGPGDCVACFKYLWCRCKICGSGVPGYVRSHIVVRTCEMVQVVASATCSLKSLKNRRFHSPMFTQHMFQYVLFT